MADQSQRTEQPTKRRRDKARDEGQFPISREFVGSLQFLAFVWIFTTSGTYLMTRTRDFARVVCIQAFTMHLDRSQVVRLYREALLTLFVPLLTAGACFTMLTFAAQLATTRFGFSLQKLAPELKRFNPAQKLTELPKQGMSSLMQAVMLLPLFGYAVYRVAADNLESYLSLPGMPIQGALQVVGDSYKTLLWKAGFVLLFLGAVDMLRQQKKHGASLRMTKQEIKEESKEMEGNPHVKQKIRRLQRDFARRSMMKDVPKATAVIVNPTHYAVAILYEMESMAAPRVVAKGRNYLARRIREIANEHLVPIVENQPLAQALYKSADVGQEIPPQLYRAVAEILAYLFKLMHSGRS